MLGRFASQEEEWVPCSDWGKSMKPYLDQVKREALMVVRNPRPQVVRAERAGRIKMYKPKPRTGRPVGHPKGRKLVSGRKCEKCDTYIRVDNTYGLCAVHAKPLRFRRWREKKAAA